MKKLFTFLFVLLTHFSFAQFSFIYNPADSTWTNIGGWSGKILYIQKDSTGLKNSYFFKFYSPLVQFNRHTHLRNDGTPTSILWANDTGALQRSPIASIQIPYTSITSAPWLTSYTETDPTVPSYVKAITSTNISNWNTVVGYGNPATQYVSLTGSYSNPGWLTSLAYSKLTGTPAIPAAQVNSDWNSSSGLSQILNKPSSSASIVTRSFSSSTGFQVSTTNNADVRYTVSIAATISLTTGQTGTVYLETSPNNSTWTTVTEFTNGNTGTLTIGLALAQTLAGQITAYVPAGYYVRLRSTGTATNTYITGQEIILGL